VFPQVVLYDKKYSHYGTFRTEFISIHTKAIQELDSYRLNADAEREVIRTEIVGLQKRLAMLETA